MGLYTTLPDELHEADVIIVGGGTAGCVIASRLADSTPELSILVIESGPDNQHLPLIMHPAAFRANWTPESKTVQFYQATAEDQLSGRESAVITGHVLGGGSSINAAIYARAQRDDYDSWKMDGWSTDDLLPFLKKFETYYGQDSEECHGYNGPIKISRGNYYNKLLAGDFVTAMNQLGYPEVQDLQDLQSSNAVSHAYRYVSPQTGRRQNAADKYLHPRAQDGNHPNLHVLVESQVLRVLFDQNKQAIGVEHRPNPKLRAKASRNVTRTIKAGRLVIISAGTLSTPLILERSGIGSHEILERAGVRTIQDLPGVGQGLQDHHIMMYTYKLGIHPEDTAESLVDSKGNVEEFIAHGDRILSWNGIDASAKVRPTEPEVDNLGPHFREIWDKDFKNAPNKPLGLMFSVQNMSGATIPLPPEPFFTIACYSAYPYSRGHVHITGTRLEDQPDFRTGYLSDDGDIDLKTQVWLYKLQREVARRMPCYRGEGHFHPNFRKDSNASRDTRFGGLFGVKTSIKYSADDDQVIEKWIRGNIGSAFHSLGTCKMGPVEQLGVVDKNLKVYGVQRLCIADMSIAPENVSGNTMSTALMVGEKAADIFAKGLRLERR